MAMEFTDQNFEEEVINSDKPVLVDFWASWCGPCQTMGPIIDQLAGAVEGKFKVGKVNVDESQATAAKFGIMSIPTIKIFKDGKEVKEFVGVQSLEVLKSELEKLV